MKKFYKLSDSEMEIMRFVWESAAPVTVTQLLSVFEERKWKAQTMSTFLTRMVEKGILDVKRQGKANVYTPVVTQEEYYQLEAQNLLNSMYNGSLEVFLSTLYSGGKIDSEGIDQLKKWFEKVSKND